MSSVIAALYHSSTSIYRLLSIYRFRCEVTSTVQPYCATLSSSFVSLIRDFLREHAENETNKEREDDNGNDDDDDDNDDDNDDDATGVLFAAAGTPLDRFDAGESSNDRSDDSINDNADTHDSIAVKDDNGGDRDDQERDSNAEESNRIGEVIRDFGISQRVIIISCDVTATTVERSTEAIEEGRETTITASDKSVISITVLVIKALELDGELEEEREEEENDDHSDEDPIPSKPQLHTAKLILETETVYLLQGKEIQELKASATVLLTVLPETFCISWW